jgi:hypothetical protein
MVGVWQARGDSNAARQAANFFADSTGIRAPSSATHRILRAGASPHGNGTDFTVRRESGAPH